MTVNGLIVILVVCAIWIIWGFKSLAEKLKKANDDLDDLKREFKRYDDWVCETFDSTFFDISIIRKHLGMDEATAVMEEELNDLDKEFHEQTQEPHGYTQGGTTQRFG